MIRKILDHINLKTMVAISLATFVISFGFFITFGLIFDRSNQISAPNNLSGGGQSTGLGNIADSSQSGQSPAATPPSSSSNSNPQPSPSPTPQPSPSPTPQPPPTPPPPPPEPSGCFVLVYSALYNMNSALNVELRIIDPQAVLRKRKHTTTNILCGSYSSPVDNTSIYTVKHFNKFGCWPSLASYYAGSDPTPADKTPVCTPA